MTGQHPSGKPPAKGRASSNPPEQLARLMREDKTIARARELIRNGLEPRQGPGWKALPELPSNDEVQHQRLAKPLPNHADTIYQDKEAYLEVQYRLLRYEGVEPLRRAVDKYRSDPLMAEDEETCIYDKVHCVSLNIIRLGPLARLRFCNLRSERLIDWGQTQRLTPGCCVALSTREDNFKTRCWVASVAGKDDKNLEDMDTPVIDVELEDAGELADFVDPMQEFVMVEARSNYYEAVRHVLSGLKQAAGESSPLMGYFTGTLKHPITIPSPDTQIDISAASKHGTSLSMPSQGTIPALLQPATGLDASQLSALSRIITSDLAVVQGPPGTGKTHTSMTALRVLLTSRAPGDAPVIVTAQKNDTVDELLVRLMEDGVKCARLGGQTKNDAVDRCTLVKLREQARLRSSRGQELERQLGFQRARAKVIINRCLPSKKVLFLGPRHLEEYGILTREQCASLVGESTYNTGGSRYPVEQHVFARWLGQRFSLRGEAQAFQLPRGNGRGMALQSQVYLAETDSSQKRRDTVSRQVINFGAWCEVLMDVPRPEQESEALAALQQYHDLTAVPHRLRPMVYRVLERQMLAASQAALRAVLACISTLVRDLKVERWLEDLAAIRSSGALVIGCTTTGLTKYRALLHALEPRVAVVEEAAESREANISGALLPSLKYLVLVGDHLQLSPHADVMALAHAPFNLHVSGFERLVLRGVAYTTLSDQRRMAGEMRAVLNAWYPALRDHEGVGSLPRVPGVGGERALWIDHVQPEGGNRYASKYNAFEARLVVGLARYLVACGTEPGRITVLSFYSGQRSYVYNTMQQVAELRTVMDPEGGFVVRKGVEVQTVDGYQGKENDVILLSVVRSPGAGEGASSVGFLDRLNRAIVALSRGKLLNVVVGNLANLLRSPGARDIWGPASEAMHVIKSGEIPLVCAPHGKAMTLVASQKVWSDPARIGCGARCGERMGCGHTCTGVCHPPRTAHTCGCGDRVRTQDVEAVDVGSAWKGKAPGHDEDLVAHMEFLIASDIHDEAGQ